MKKVGKNKPAQNKPVPIVIACGPLARGRMTRAKATSSPLPRSQLVPVTARLDDVGTIVPVSTESHFFVNELQQKVITAPP